MTRISVSFGSNDPGQIRICPICKFILPRHDLGCPNWLSERVGELRQLLADCVASLAGYRRERNDGQPCDAEKAAIECLKRDNE